MAMARYLDRSEHGEMHRPTAHIAYYRGDLDVEAMHEAWAVLCVTHPALTARVRHDGNGYLLEAQDSMKSPPTLIRGSIEDLVKQRLRQWDLSRGVADLLLVQNFPDSAVALLSDHVITDGAHRHALFRELWATYLDLVKGNAPTAAAGQLPLSPSQVALGRFGVRNPEPAYPFVEELSLDRTESHRINLSFTKTQSAGLTALAKEAGITINAAISSAAVLTTARALASRDEVVENIRCVVPVNIRARLEPPVAATDVTNLTGPQTGHVDLLNAADLISVAQILKPQFELGMASQNPVLQMLGVCFTAERRTAPPASDQAVPTVVVSNMGRIDPLPGPPGFSVVDYEKITLLYPGVDPLYVAHSYAERLRIQCVYNSTVHSLAEAETMAHEMRENLCSILPDD